MSYQARDLSPLVRGDDWTIKLTLSDSGSPLNITGYTYWFTLKDNIDDADPGALQVSITPSASGSPSEASQGIVYITAAKALTDTVTPATYNYDVQQVDGTGKVQTLLIGKVKVVKDVTRSIA
jgi:hypothetical protein